MGRIESYRDLIAWQKAMDLVVCVYGVTETLPTHEQYGLRSQMRRSAVSIVSNIAKGWGRHSTSHYLRFLRTSRGSAFELLTQSEICQRLRYGGEWSDLIDRGNEVSRILGGLIRSLERRDTASP